MSRELFEAAMQKPPFCWTREIELRTDKQGNYKSFDGDFAWAVWQARDAEVQTLRARVAELETRLVYLELDKNAYINYVGDALGQDRDRETLWDAAQRVLSSRERIRVERDELEAQIAAHQRVCAGMWVPVGERLPEEYRIVDVVQDDYQIEYLTTFVNGRCITDAGGRPIQRVTHWRDDKMPTSSGEG